MKHKKILLIVVMALVVLLAGTSVSCGIGEDNATQNSLVTPKPTEATQETTPAPDFTVLDYDGNEVKLSDFKGTPVVLNFWASWCPPCKSEMPDFDEIYQDYKGKICFMMVNLTDGTQETIETAKGYVEGEGCSFPVYFDTKSEGAMAYGVYSIPTTFFIDANGDVVAYASGALSKEGLQKGIDMIYE